jgi:parallel beta-helix repeat protein
MIKKQEKNHSRLLCALRHALLVFVFIVVACPNVFGTVYYVDSTWTGPTTNGAKETPWNTLKQVNDFMGSFAAGDSIRFKRGSTFSAGNFDNRMLIITASGTAENPIVFETYGVGELPVIDGSQVLDGTWKEETSLGADIWSYDYSLLDPDNHRPNVLYYEGVPKPSITTLKFDSVPDTLLANAILLQFKTVYTSFWVTSVDSAANTVSGITFFDIKEGVEMVARQLDAGGRMSDIPQSPLSNPTFVTSQEDLNRGLAQYGRWYWYGDSVSGIGKIYLKSEGPPDAKVEIGYVGDYSGDAEEVDFPAVKIQSAHNIILKDLKIQKCNESAVVISNGSTNITVEGLDISKTGLDGIKLRDSSNNTITGNTIDDVGIGISIWAFPGDNDAVNNQILNNDVMNCRTKCVSVASGGDPSEVSGNRIADNRITNSNTMEYDSAGIYTFYAGSNTIEANTIKDGGSKYLVSAGIMVDVSGAPMTISRNTLENNSNAGIAVSGAGHQIAENILRNNGLPSWRMTQLTLFGTTGSPAVNCRITGNTMEADQDHHFIYAEPGSQTGHFIDNNVYISPSEKLFSWSNSWDEVWMDFKDWRGKTGHDCNSTLNSVAYPKDSCPRYSFFFLPAIISGSLQNK